MAKGFMEVFPELRIEDELKGLLKLVEVERVSAPRDRSSLRVYINSPRLIDKRNIHALERGIRDQLFPEKKLTIKIMEKYSLSGQYNPEKLFQVYKESILYELKNYSIVEYNILRKADCTFPRENLLRITVENNEVFREKTGELKRVLEKIFFERCGLALDVEYEFVEPSKALIIMQRQEQVQREIEEKIRSHPALAGKFSGEAGAEGAQAGSFLPDPEGEKAASGARGQESGRGSFSDGQKGAGGQEGLKANSREDLKAAGARPGGEAPANGGRESGDGASGRSLFPRTEGNSAVTREKATIRTCSTAGILRTSSHISGISAARWGR